MPGDALTYHFLARELDATIAGGRIEKISMPESDEVFLSIRKDRQNYILTLSAGPNCRAHITKAVKENPLTPPAFCMNLRKNIGGGIIEKITAEPFERILYIDILFKNELGVRDDKRLICEIMGKYSNIILCGAGGRIMECLVHIPLDVSVKRSVFPGLKYQIPALDKLSPLDYDGILNLKFDDDPHDEILRNVKGLAPASIAEAVYNANVNDNSAQSKKHIADALAALFSDSLAPCILNGDERENNKNKHTKTDFFIRKFNSIGGDYVCYNTISEAMDAHFTQRDAAARLNTKAKALSTTAKNALKRAEKRLAELYLRLKESEDFEKERINGELITANIYKIKSGMTILTADNYYSGETAQIPLDPLLSPAQNAQRFYKKYAKKKRTILATTEQIAKTEAEKAAIEEILYSLDNLTAAAEIPDIREELTALGLLRAEKTRGKEKPSSPFVREIDGFKVYIGKNNVQNDRLVRNAARDDIWLHVKNSHGSHVVIESGRRPVPESVIATAAGMAAYYSKAKSADKTEVDWTLVKYVSKPAGSLPGKVVYFNQRTLVVVPKDLGVE
ncbi:MAG: NFACT family protein [Firmicutes bacterium]|nr:NFACT family protein [Bacillota bacterium]